jgi:SAM-dependent methyltransferase
VGAFSVLAFSGFSVFEQLGQFTAMGIGFAFLFVHTVMPRLLKSREPGPPASRLWFSRIVDRLASTGWPGLAAALVLAAILAVFMRPHFNTDLRAMNCVSRETRAADELMAAVWGDIFNSVYLMTEADDPAALQEVNDRLLTQLEADTRAGKIEFTVTPSLFFPGRQRSLDNVAAWRQFWTSERIRKVTADLNREGRDAGFANDAFTPFLRTLATGTPAVSPIPQSVQPLLGISRDSTDGRYRQVIRIIPAEQFDHRGFYDRLSVLGTVFDPDLFSKQMGQLLFSTFLKMFLIIGVSLAVLLVLFFADAGIVITALLPLAFAFVCTLGSLGLMGRALDIPALMLSVIILGMGVDYTLFMVRGYQRYQRFDHPHYTVVRTAICMAAGSTLVGFAVLLTAEHNLLQSAGLIAFFGIGYCLVGSLLILPPLLKHRFERPIPATGGIYRRYRNMEPYPRMFARFKQRLDPLFGELAGLVPDRSDLTNILDVGCGYGVPACWMADRYATALIHGLEPDSERVRVASLALGERGRIVRGAAPDLPAMDVLVDMVTILDMSHYLQDWELEKTLTGVNDRLLPGGRLVMRSVLPPGASRHWTWYLEHLRLKYHGMAACYRDARATAEMLERCGFTIEKERLSGERQDMVWHVAKPR